MKKVREGYKMTELGEIPEEWEVKEIQDICIKVTDGEHQNPQTYSEGIPLVSAKDLKERDIDFRNVKFVSEEDYHKFSTKCNPESGDVLIVSRGATIGRSISLKSDKKFALMGSVLLVKLNNSKFNGKFLTNYLQLANVQKRLLATSGSSAQQAIYIKDILKLKVLWLKIEEQEEISSILSSVDEQIEITDNLIVKTKELKKGLIQRILIKGIGHDKFKDTEIGSIPEGWGIRRLIDISQGKGEYGIGAVATEYVIGNPRYLRITDIGDDSRLLFNDIKGLGDDEYEKYILKLNDIVFARTGNTTGKSYVYCEKDGQLVYAGFLIKFTVNPKLVNVNFMKYIFQSKRYWDWINVMSTRSGQPGINSNEYAGFLVPIPDIKEQSEIALILSSVDEKIDQYEVKKEKLQELKKGLMQKLLTGKIRVQ